MEILQFDEKSKSGFIGELPTNIMTARIHSGSIFVDFKDMAILQQKHFGHYLGERQDRVASHLIKELDEHETSGHIWGEKRLEIPNLRLSPEEAAYLGCEKEVLQVFLGNNCLSKDDLWKYVCEKGSIKKIAVFFKLKKLGWIVRSGISFGCHYIIYRNGPESYHASAAIKINTEFDAEDFVALNRALYNVRKACIVARVTIPPSLRNCNFSCFSQISVELITTTTFFPQQHATI